MKIVVGIDPSHSADNVLNLLRRLRFREAQAVYASFVPYPVLPPPGLATVSEELAQKILNEQRDLANRSMREASEGLRDVVPGDEKVFDIGDPADRLESLAEERGADLVAIGSRHHTPLEAAILGSVGRGLTLHAKRSLLVAKGEILREGPLRAVFAYDGSKCCEESLDLLLRLRPAGISQIDVVIVDTPDPGNSPVVSLFGEGAFYRGQEHRQDVMLGFARPVAKRLHEAGYEARAICPHGPVHETLRGAMIDSRADLMIVGAQGHGTIERILLGSKALEQVVGEPHSVLILRPAKE